MVGKVKKKVKGSNSIKRPIQPIAVGVLGWVRYYWSKLTNFKEYSRYLTDYGNVEVGNTIYGYFDDVKSYVRIQNRVHQLFKYLVLIPGLHFTRWLLGNYLVTDTTDMKQIKGNPYRNLILFSDTFDKSLENWHCTYLKQTNLSNVKINLNTKKSVYDNTSVQQLVLMKQLMLTMCKNDTAYLEFFNILFYNLLQDGYDTLDDRINHLFYTSKSIKDIRYFVFKETVEGIGIHEIKVTQAKD